MKVIKILSLICFLTIGIWAQNSASVSGQLSDNGKVIANEKVRLVSPTQVFETTTDASGNYRFENIADGKYLLVYKDKQASVAVKGGQVSIGNLGEVVVISAGEYQTVEQVSKTINVIGAQEMRDRADFSLAESLKVIPGFRVQQLGGFGRTASIKTRGLRNQDTAILIDGLRFRDASAITGDASSFLSDFTLTSVDRIEVLRGSGSSLYGTNAIGGVVDIQTPRPPSGFHGQFSSAFGGYGLQRYRGNVSDGTNNGKFGYTLGVSRTLYTKGIDDDDDAHNTNFQSRIEYNPTSRTNLSGRFFVSDAFVKLNSNPDTIGPLPATTTIIDAIPLAIPELNRYAAGTPIGSLNRGTANFIPETNDPDNFQKSKFFNGQFVLTQSFGDNLVFQGSYQGLKSSRRNQSGLLGVGFQSDSTSFFDGLIHTANGHFNWTPDKINSLTFGYEYEWEKFGNDGVATLAAANFFVRAKQTSNTFYVQDLLGFFNNKLQLAGGFRAQIFSLKDPTFSRTNPPYNNLTLENPPTSYTFDGSASYFFDKSGTKIRAHVGNGYRVPSLFERFGTTYSRFSQTFTALGDPNLKPERSIAFDGGIDQNTFGNRAKLSAVYFYTKLIDTIGFANSAPSIGSTTRPFGGYFNTKGGISRGAEFSGQVKATDSTDIFASYTFTNSDQLVPQVSGTGVTRSLGIPDHQFTLVATQRFQRFWVNFDLLATSNYLVSIFSNTTFNGYVYRFKGARKGDLTAGYTIPLAGEKLNLRLFGTIENVFGYEYFENGFRTFDRTGRAGFALGF